MLGTMKLRVDTYDSKKPHYEYILSEEIEEVKKNMSFHFSKKIKIQSKDIMQRILKGRNVKTYLFNPDFPKIDEVLNKETYQYRTIEQLNYVKIDFLSEQTFENPKIIDFVNRLRHSDKYKEVQRINMMFYYMFSEKQWKEIREIVFTENLKDIKEESLLKTGYIYEKVIRNLVKIYEIIEINEPKIYNLFIEELIEKFIDYSLYQLFKEAKFSLVLKQEEYYRLNNSLDYIVKNIYSKMKEFNKNKKLKDEIIDDVKPLNFNFISSDDSLFDKIKKINSQYSLDEEIVSVLDRYYTFKHFENVYTKMMSNKQYLNMKKNASSTYLDYRANFVSTRSCLSYPLYCKNKECLICNVIKELVKREMFYVYNKYLKELNETEDTLKKEITSLKKEYLKILLDFKKNME